ncbi:hypothetical protein [Cytobacillus praedii]|uniref:hypothetical protein n=1 Tax=Cytobacillus praedii TaxID=1742358 RepID=UPI002E1C99EB|nr:hypothetical protein [Cytobacillus praedii]
MTYKRHSELNEEERKEYREHVRMVRERNKRKATEEKRRRMRLLLSVSIIIISFVSYIAITSFKEKENISVDSETHLDLGITEEGTILVHNKSDAEFYGLAVDNGNEAGIQNARENGIILKKGTKVRYGATEDYRLYYVKVLEGKYVGEDGYVHFMDISKIKN